MDILEELSAARRADAVAAERIEPAAVLERRIATLPPPLDFRAAFAGDGLRVIAELKKASPSEGVIRPDFNPVPLARAYAAQGAAAISVLCEPHRFLGNDADLPAIRRAVSVPLLYKDFITTHYQILRARVCGADAVLLIAAVLDDAALRDLLAFTHTVRLTALVEAHTVEEVRRAVDAGAGVVGVNGRDLRTFRTDPGLTADLIARLPPTVTRIAESGMRTAEDVRRLHAAGADGFLIGTALMRAPSPGRKLAELIGNLP